MASQRTTLKNLVPALVIPDHFFCNQTSKVVVIYDEPIGKEEDMVTLIFPGDVSGSPSKKIVPERIGNRTLVFDTPVYSSCRGLVEVLPLLSQPNGEEAPLANFKLSLKHPIRNVMELCLNLSTYNAILPVLLSLMVHCESDDSKEHFQDPHIDRVMATLVGSQTPGNSSSIQDILLPSRKWRRMNLIEFARHFQLNEMEKQAYVLSRQRSKRASKPKNSPKRSKTILRTSQTIDNDAGDPEEEDDLDGDRLHQYLSSSTPDIHSLEQHDQRDSGVSDETDVVQKFIKCAKSVCLVVEDFTPNHDEPSCIPLRVDQEVYVVQETSPDWWYGVSDDRCGYFPPSYVTLTKVAGNSKKRSKTHSESAQNVMSSKQRSDLSTSCNGHLSPHKFNYSNLSPPNDQEREDIENVRRQPESASSRRHNQRKAKPNPLTIESVLKRRESRGRTSGFQSDDGMVHESPSHTTQNNMSMPLTKQQMLHNKVAPILPPMSQKPNHSHQHHSPSPPWHSANHPASSQRTGSAGGESTNVEGSDSDSYEEILSGEDEDTVIKTSWTTRKETQPKEEASAHKPFVRPSLRKKILPSEPDPPLPAWEATSRKQPGPEPRAYEDVVQTTPDYINIAIDAFEMVEDHIYDCAHIPEQSSSSSMMYHMTATDAHVKAVATHMALAHNQKPTSPTDRKRANDSSSNPLGGRQWPHSVKTTADSSQADKEGKTSMSPRSIAFIPPRNVPRTSTSPVHQSNVGQGTLEVQHKQKRQTVTSPHSKSPLAVADVNESPALPVKTFAFPTSLSNVIEQLNSPAVPLTSSKAAAPTPPPKTPKSVTSPKKALPVPPPKQAPPPPPRTSTLRSSETPDVPLKLSSQSNSPLVHPKPSKKPAGVPTPPPKPSKQEPPTLPPKSGNPQTHHSFCQPPSDTAENGHTNAGRHHATSISLAMCLAAAQQQGNLASKRYFKPS